MLARLIIVARATPADRLARCARDIAYQQVYKIPSPRTASSSKAQGLRKPAPRYLKCLAIIIANMWGG